MKFLTVSKSCTNCSTNTTCIHIYSLYISFITNYIIFKFSLMKLTGKYNYDFYIFYINYIA